MSKGYKKGNGPGVNVMHCSCCGKKRSGNLTLSKEFEGRTGDKAIFVCFQGHRTNFTFQEKNQTFKVSA